MAIGRVYNTRRSEVRLGFSHYLCYLTSAGLCMKSPPDLKLIEEFGPDAVICFFLSGSALMNMEGQREKENTEKLTIYFVKY